MAPRKDPDILTNVQVCCWAQWWGFRNSFDGG